MTDLILYNTLSKKKEVFQPINPGKVGMYVCGPTVYDYVHIGNLRAYVCADTLRRVLEDIGYEVRLIKNITDVGHLTDDDIAQGDSGEDKLVKKALAEKSTPEAIAEFYTNYFFDTEKKLDILPAQYTPKATAHIPHIIRFIETLIAKGHAYSSNGAVFYDVTTFPDYGKLSGNTLEQLKTGARLEPHPDKKHPWDFALWLPAPKEHLMHWPSPWGEGYPGWHIECSVMSQEYLGDTFDIHTGGEDNIFPHHEAEIAQSTGLSGKPLAHYFLHTRHMLVDGEKMSKSRGTVYTLEDIERHGFDALDLRMLYLSAHYRSQMNFTWEALEQAKKNKETLFTLYERLGGGSYDALRMPKAKHELESLKGAFSDDLNTPLALADVLEHARAINKRLDTHEEVDKEAVKSVLQEIFWLFGLSYAREVAPDAVQELAHEREAARKAKDFARADELREAIEKVGYRVEDTESGSTLHKL